MRLRTALNLGVQAGSAKSKHPCGTWRYLAADRHFMRLAGHGVPKRTIHAAVGMQRRVREHAPGRVRQASVVDASRAGAVWR